MHRKNTHRKTCRGGRKTCRGGRKTCRGGRKGSRRLHGGITAGPPGSGGCSYVCDPNGNNCRNLCL